MQTRVILRVFAIFLFTAFFTGVPKVSLAEDFYAGKTIRFVVGYPPGGGYDTYARATARYMGRHVPGNPTTVVENMDGASSLVSANYLYNKAKPDGLTIGSWNANLVMQQALSGRGIRFDARNFGWIGSPSIGFPTCGIMGFTGLRNLTDIVASKREIKMGGTRPGAGTDDFPKLMNELMGTKFKVISGYRGTALIRVAMQKKEVDGACWTWDSMRVTARSMLDAKGDDRFIPFIVHGKSTDPEIKDIPQYTDVIKGTENLTAFKAYVNPYDFQRPLTLPPNTPKDRIDILRKAYEETVHDPEFLAEAEKSKLLITYVSPEKIENYVEEILSIPEKTKSRLQFLTVVKERRPSN
jgi:tripartite-type tricarboxylate transporter receptor subunit TctC